MVSKIHLCNYSQFFLSCLPRPSSLSIIILYWVDAPDPSPMLCLPLLPCLISLLSCPRLTPTYKLNGNKLEVIELLLVSLLILSSFQILFEHESVESECQTLTFDLDLSMASVVTTATYIKHITNEDKSIVELVEIREKVNFISFREI